MPSKNLRGLAEKFEDLELVQYKLKDASGIVWFAIQYPGKIFVWVTCCLRQLQSSLTHLYANASLDIVFLDREKYACSRVAGENEQSDPHEKNSDTGIRVF